MCVVGAFDRILHEGSIWNWPRAFLSFTFHKSIFLNFVHHGIKCYDKCLKSDDRKKYIDDNGSGIFPKQKVKLFYNARYQEEYSNQNYVLDRDYIKDTRIHWVHSGRKRKATGFVYLKGSPYRDTEWQSQLKLCLHDGIINAAPIIGGSLKIGIVSTVST